MRWLSPVPRKRGHVQGPNRPGQRMWSGGCSAGCRGQLGSPGCLGGAERDANATEPLGELGVLLSHFVRQAITELLEELPLVLLLLGPRIAVDAKEFFHGSGRQLQPIHLQPISRWGETDR